MNRRGDRLGQAGQLRVVLAGRLEYALAREVMRGLVEYKRSHPEAPQWLILCEHPPVITLGRRGSPADVLGRGKKIEVVEVERGGLATYHGPGQVVAYPIVNLRAVGLGVRGLVGALMEAMAGVVRSLGLTPGRREGHPGVWVGGKKVGFVGLAVRGGVSFHGVSLNYGDCLEGFRLISPCGLDPREVGSLGEFVDTSLGWADLAMALGRELCRTLNLELVWSPLQELARAAGVQIRVGEGL